MFKISLTTIGKATLIEWLAFLESIMLEKIQTISVEIFKYNLNPPRYLIRFTEKCNPF
jgi:hypothetical protein